MTNKDQTPERYALISVSDKTGIADFARAMVRQGFRLLSTGGTATVLRDAGVDVTDVSQYTGFPEMMAGRVKTLHPLVHGGILGRGNDLAVMDQHGIAPIDLVVVNLYPFEAVTSDPACSLEDAIENIDIGGPAMVRSAAKNHQRVSVITDPEDYPEVAKELAETGRVQAQTRFRLAVKAFAHTARYDTLIAAYLARASGQAGSVLPETHKPVLIRSQSLRYGENPHQHAAFYHHSGAPDQGFGRQLQGKELSYNNIADADAAWECVLQFSDQAACIIVKHANPCGGATADSIGQAYELAYATDPVSAFGGIIAFNREVEPEVAARILERQFVELVIAPGFSDEALRRFSGKPNVRVLATPVLEPDPARLDFHQVAGGMLIQQHDSMQSNPAGWKCVTRQQPDSQDSVDLEFAWKMVRMVKSNAIVYAKNCRSLGIGAGQMSRVDSARIAAWKAEEAGLSLQGSVMASDAFFPFRDSIDAAAKVGVKTIIQPGGSMRDDEVIAAADEHGMSMVFTGIRHFRH